MSRAAGIMRYLARAPRWIGWLILGLGTILFGVGLYLGMESNPFRPRWDRLKFLDVVWGLSVQSIPLVGIVVLLRRRDHPMGWLLALMGLGLSAGLASSEYVSYAAIVPNNQLPAVPWVAWLSSWLLMCAYGPLPFVLLLFPNGELGSRRWRWVARFLLMALVLVASSQLAPGQVGEVRGVGNPVGIPGANFLKTLSEWALVAFGIGVVASATAPIVRFRRSRGVERQQLKWFALGAAVFGGLASLLALLEWSGLSNHAFGTGLFIVMMICLSGGMAIGILKYRLYDLDLVINRALVYGALTAVLAGSYIGLVFVFQRALSPLTQESDLAIAASTLAVAALFGPARSRVQGFIDRRFYRRKFDAQQTVEDFGATLRDQVELGSVTNRLIGAVHDTMQPAHVSLWLRAEARR